MPAFAGVVKTITKETDMNAKQFADTITRKKHIERKLNRRQSLAAKFRQALDDWGLSNRRMKIRYQY